MKLSIIVPVYNEEKTIKQVISKLLAVKLPCLPAGRPVQKEIIIIDDGSTDTTSSEIKKNISPISHIRLITHKTNQGKGSAVRSGIKASTGDYILIQDADLEYYPAEIPNLLKALRTPRMVAGKRASARYDSSEVERSENRPVAVYGSRFKNNQAIIPFLYLLGNKFLTLLTNLLYGTKLTDMETGYKLLPSSFLKQVTLLGNRFEIEPEITAKLVKKGYKIIEVPISYRGRTHLTGKKLTFTDAFGAIKTLLKYDLS